MARGLAARPLRAPGATKLAMGPSLWNEVPPSCPLRSERIHAVLAALLLLQLIAVQVAAAGSTAMLLLADDIETKTDRLYNGVPITGNVEVRFESKMMNFNDDLCP